MNLYLGNCDFESGLCAWTNDAASKEAWSSFKPDTSFGTPAGDHTVGSTSGNSKIKL